MTKLEVSIDVNPSEALVSNETFSSSLVYMAFGIPPMFTE